MDIHEEDLKILNYILNNLTEESDRDLSKFSCHLSDDYIEKYDDEDKEEKFSFKGRVKEFKISHTTNSKDVGFRFTPVYGTVSISIGYNVSREFNVGYGPKHKDIKIKIMKLFYKIATYQEVEIPRQRREKFINDVVKTFPNLFDHLILGDEDGKKEDK